MIIYEVLIKHGYMVKMKMESVWFTSEGAFVDRDKAMQAAEMLQNELSTITEVAVPVTKLPSIDMSRESETGTHQSIYVIHREITE